MDNAQQDLCRIPGSGESDDPCSGNPFPADDFRYEVWTAATRRAEQELAQLKVGLLSRRPVTPQQVAALLLDLHAEKFRIWARRGVQVVWGDFNIPAFDNWLSSYAESTLRTIDGQCPVGVTREDLLIELRLMLMQQIEYWKAEARRYVSEQPSDMSRGDQTEPGTERTSEALPVAADELTRVASGPTTKAMHHGTERRRAVDAYIEEVFSRTQKLITRTDIWKFARYKSRTEFERWERNDRRATKAANKHFTRILAEKPHLK